VSTPATIQQQSVKPKVRIPVRAAGWRTSTRTTAIAKIVVIHHSSPPSCLLVPSKHHFIRWWRKTPKSQFLIFVKNEGLACPVRDESNVWMWCTWCDCVLEELSYAVWLVRFGWELKKLLQFEVSGRFPPVSYVWCSFIFTSQFKLQLKLQFCCFFNWVSFLQLWRPVYK